MKKTNILYAVLILLALALAIGTNVARIDFWQDKFDSQAAIDREQSKQIEELKKEIRLLKTDVYILQNGYEEAE